MPVMIDAHHHLWDLAAREHRWLAGGQSWAGDDELARLRRSFTLADLAPLAVAAGVTGTVVIQTVTEPWETPRPGLVSRRWITVRSTGRGLARRRQWTFRHTEVCPNVHYPLGSTGSVMTARCARRPPGWRR
jgi:hypothetical protein